MDHWKGKSRGWYPQASEPQGLLSSDVASIYIYHLPKRANAADLIRYFTLFGAIKGCDRQKMDGLEFAIINFWEASSARGAWILMHGYPTGFNSIGVECSIMTVMVRCLNFVSAEVMQRLGIPIKNSPASRLLTSDKGLAIPSLPVQDPIWFYSQENAQNDVSQRQSMHPPDISITTFRPSQQATDSQVSAIQ